MVDNIPKQITKDVANLVADELELGDEGKYLVDKGIDMGYKSQGKGTQKASSNPWISHVKAFALQNGISYRDALKNPQVKSTYVKGGMFSFKKLGRIFKPAVPIAKEIAKDVAKDAVKDAILGAGRRHLSKNKIHNEGGTLLKGIPKSLNSRAKTRDHILTNGLVKGGSFLPLGDD